MYLDPVHFAGVPRLTLRPSRRPDMSDMSLARSRFQKAKPQIQSGGGYPVWATCGNLPGSGSPCHRQAVARFNELKAQGMAWPQIRATMQAEGSLRHYAGL